MDPESDEEEYTPSPAKKSKGKATPGIPIKGFGARRVAVPGVAPTDVQEASDSDHDDEDPEPTVEIPCAVI